MAGVVHRHDGARARRDRGRDGLGVEAERVGVDVAEDRPRARAHDHVGGRGPGQRRRDDLVALALADAERAQREVHRGRAGGDGERDRGLGVERELALQLPRERAGRQPAGLERAQDVGALLVAERGRREVEPVLAAHGRPPAMAGRSSGTAMGRRIGAPAMPARTRGTYRVDAGISISTFGPWRHHQAVTTSPSSWIGVLQALSTHRVGPAGRGRRVWIADVRGQAPQRTLGVRRERRTTGSSYALSAPT